MRPKEVEIENLTKMLRLNRKDFKRVLSRMGIQIPSNQKVIKVVQAERIFFDLRGENINWRKLDDDRRSEEQGNLVYNSDAELLTLADLVISKSGFENVADYLIGFASFGGFLADRPKEPFVFTSFQDKNLIIGDRGTGKSTLISLIAGLSATSRTSRSFFSEDILSAELVGRSDIVAEKIINLRKVLDDYSISKYVNLYRKAGRIYAISIQPKLGWCAHVFEKDKWRLLAEDEIVIPSVFYLKQGDVFRIADVADDLVFSKLFDAVNPEITQQRSALLDACQKFQRQISNTDIRYSKDTTYEITRRLEYIGGRIKKLTDLTLSGKINHALFSLYNILHDSPVLDQDNSLFLVRDSFETRDDVTTAILAPIRAKLKRIREKFYDTSNGRYVRRQCKISKDVDFSSSSFIDELDAISKLLVVQHKIVSEILLLHQGVPIPDDEFIAFLNTFIEIQALQFAIRNNQSQACDSANDLISEYIPAQFSLSENEVTAFVSQNEITDKLHFRKFAAEHYNPSVNSNSRDLRNRLKKYRQFAEHGIAFSENLSPDPLPIRYEEVADCINATLKQGNIAVPFTNLSFGQKSGLVLGLILSLAKTDAIVLDQPEDNLDTSGVVTVLIPLLQKLRSSSQAFIASHNAHLVMGIRPATIISTESHGDYSRVGISGVLDDIEVLKVVLSVLEGGIESFNSKIQIYSDFVRQISSHIDGVDLSEIERIFRNMTIQGLTHFLMPLITDGELLEREILAFAQHETRSQDRGVLIQRVDNLKESLSGLVEIGKLDKSFERKMLGLFNSLGSHIQKIEKAVKKVRMLDTSPKPSSVNLYDLILEASEEVAKPLRDNRNIRVIISRELREKMVYVDKNHFSLVIENLVSNSLNSILVNAISAHNDERQFEEKIVFEMVSNDENEMSISISDNGIGLTDEKRTKLYKVRASSENGEFRGLGGMIISKLLQVNHSSIKIIDNNSIDSEFNCVQIICIPTSSEGKE